MVPKVSGIKLNLGSKSLLADELCQVKLGSS